MPFEVTSVPTGSVGEFPNIAIIQWCECSGFGPNHLARESELLRAIALDIIALPKTKRDRVCIWKIGPRPRDHFSVEEIVTALLG
eukprot:CCRYP_001574-RA/>CCRYP_001574-RA protein AED:0.21 eAED:0.26 QI:0/0/0.5/1/0/0/2/1399/84